MSHRPDPAGSPSTTPGRWHGWWIGAAVVAAVTIVAAGAGVFGGFEPADVDRRSAFLRALVGAGIGATLAWLAGRALQRSPSSPPLHTTRALQAVLVSVCAIAAITTAPRTNPDTSATVTSTIATDRSPTTPTRDDSPVAARPGNDTSRSSDDVGSGLMGVVISFGLAAIIAIMLTYRRLRDDRRGRLAPWGRAPDLPPAASLDEAAVARSFDDGLRVLLDDPDPRRAVIAAYATLLDGLAAAGAARERYEAPEEHLRRALSALEIPAESASEVTDLFLLARFSDHALGEADRTHAVTALRRAQRHLLGRTVQA